MPFIFPPKCQHHFSGGQRCTAYANNTGYCPTHSGRTPWSGTRDTGVYRGKGRRDSPLGKSG